MKGKVAVIMGVLIGFILAAGISFAVNKIFWTVNVTVTPGDFVVPVGKEVIDVAVKVGDKANFNTVLMNNSDQPVPFNFSAEIIEGLSFYMADGNYSHTAPAMLQSSYVWSVEAHDDAVVGAFTNTIYADD
jgi:hypothetical protein